MRLEDRRDESMDGRGDPERLTHAHHRAAQPGQFQPPMPFEVLEHRRSRLGGQLLDERPQLVKEAPGQVDALGPGHRNGLDEGRLPHGEQIRIVTQRSDRRPRHGGHPAQRGQVDELGPDLDVDLLAERRADAGVAARLEQALEPRRSCAVELAEHDTVEREVTDDAGLFEGRLNVRRVPPARCRRSTARDSMSTLSTPFCNGMTTVSGPTSGGSSGSADSVSYSFTAKRATSTGPTRRRIVGRRHAREMKVAVRALDAQAVRLERGEVRAACQEG